MRERMFAGTAVTRPDAVGSLYTTTPGGEWRPVRGVPADASVQAVTPHPDRPDVVFAAARKGLYRSTDAGDTWHRLEVTDEQVQFWSVVVSPHDPDTVFAGTSPVGFFRSSDGGTTWKRCAADHPERFEMSFGGSRTMRIAFHPADPNVLYAASEVNGFLVSEDGGATWRGEPAGILELAALPHLKNTELTDDDTEGMFDGHSVCTTPARPGSVFYICRLGIFESADRGRSFRDLEVGRFAPFSYTRDCRPVAGHPASLYACFSISSRSEAGAVYRSDDVGGSWRRANTGVDAVSTVMGFGVHASDPGGLVAVTRHGQALFTLDGSRTWAEQHLPADAGDAFCAAII
ncbi:MAG TPA: hypothetical protein VGL93_13915 [Streptosporangiaceae bacterium]|jgi:photosystem II stability/assembly factor-like uncharacterized protein